MGEDDGERVAIEAGGIAGDDAADAEEDLRNESIQGHELSADSA